MSTTPCWKKWWVAMRPFAFPASVAPVLLGTALAAVLTNEPFHPVWFVMALLAMMALHAGANILSDISDYERGLDKEATPVSGAIVRGWLTPGQARVEAVVLLGVGVVLGLVITLQTTPVLLVVGGLGLVVGIGYTLPPFRLKYRALGDLAVFLNFGLLGALGAWLVQTRTFSWMPIIHAVPVGLHVIGILHANNWRDALSDRRAGFHTIAGLLGDRRSLVYYAALIFGPFLWVTLTVAASRRTETPLPLTTLAVWLAWPIAWKCWRKAVRRHAPQHALDFITLDGATAQLNIVFGLLYAAGVVLLRLWHRLV